MAVNTDIRRVLTVCFMFLFAVSPVSCGSSGGENSSRANVGSLTTVEGTPSHADVSLQNPLIGSWVSGDHTLVFNSDSRSVRAFNHDDIPAVLGSVVTSGNVIIVTDISDGRHSCVNSVTGEFVSGTYTYAINGNTLIFNRVHDPCVDRAAFLGLAYIRQ
jgi:hypothetical protein